LIIRNKIDSMEERLPFFPKRGYVPYFFKTLNQPTTYNLFYHLFIISMMKDIRQGWVISIFPSQIKNTLIILLSTVCGM
jgi:hypothetical protein